MQTSFCVHVGDLVNSGHLTKLTQPLRMWFCFILFSVFNYIKDEMFKMVLERWTERKPREKVQHQLAAWVLVTRRSECFLMQTVRGNIENQTKHVLAKQER